MLRMCKNKALGSLIGDPEGFGYNRKGGFCPSYIPKCYKPSTQKSSLFRAVHGFTQQQAVRICAAYTINLATDSPFRSDNVETADKQVQLQGDMVWSTNKEVNGYLITVRQDRKRYRQVFIPARPVF